MQRSGSIVPGYLDVMIIPCVLAMSSERVWVMEYDVDYTGRWADFFAQFTDRDSDLMTTTLTHISDCQDWAHWPAARCPSWVDRRFVHRAFHPLMRLSRSFAGAYALMMLDQAWAGHAEFTLPTAALAAGAVVEDIGGEGPLTPPALRDTNYLNTPSDPDLSPGTFVWRPPRQHYFHERPDEFDLPGRLYHPVKSGLAAWD
jgi:hypothetical protein